MDGFCLRIMNDSPYFTPAKLSHYKVSLTETSVLEQLLLQY